MAITFAVRGNSLDARYSKSGKVPSLFVTTSSITVISGAGTGIIGDAYINQANATFIAGLLYPGASSLPQGQAWSVLIRALRPSANDTALWSFKSPLDNSREYARMLYSQGAGAFYFAASTKENTDIFPFGSLGGVMTTNTWFDIVLTCTGTTAAGGLKFYLDGALVSTNTLTRAFVSPISYMNKNILVGYGGIETAQMRTNEFVVWDEVIDPTAVQLTSGVGSLNGVSRTAFVDVAAFDGQVNSPPAVDKVSRSLTYVVAGSSYVGTLGMIDPGVLNVRVGTTYEINSASLTGTLVVPGAGNVKLGTVFDNGTVGTLQSTNPGSSNVVAGVPYIIESASFTGAYLTTNPGVANVKSGTTYVYAGVSLTGTLLSTNPGSTNVVTGVSYTINSVGFVGVYEIPPESTDPGVANVKLGTTYLFEGVSKVGSLTSINPGVGNVKKGVDYTINSVDFEGTFISGLNPNSGNFSPVPQVQGAMLNYFQNMQFVVVEKSVEGFQNAEVGTEINFRGVFQPAGPRVLQMKPEGQRTWKWFIVHSNRELPLQPDDVIDYKGVQYRVKSDKNYALYGYYEYEIIEDWTGAGP
jgi:hypothetical protein